MILQLIVDPTVGIVQGYLTTISIAPALKNFIICKGPEKIYNLSGLIPAKNDTSRSTE